MNEFDITKTAEKLADEHVKWFITVIEKIYRDAFIHGFKHGLEEAEKWFTSGGNRNE